MPWPKIISDLSCVFFWRDFSGIIFPWPKIIPDFSEIMAYGLLLIAHCLLLIAQGFPGRNLCPGDSAEISDWGAQSQRPKTHRAKSTLQAADSSARRRGRLELRLRRRRSCGGLADVCSPSARAPGAAQDHVVCDALGAAHAGISPLLAAAVARYKAVALGVALVAPE